jgi:hypothetical protein
LRPAVAAAKLSRGMTELTYIQGGDGGRRVWTRRLGEPSTSAITVLNGRSREHWIRDVEGAFSIKWMPQGRALYPYGGRKPRPERRRRGDPQPGAALRT